MKQASFFCIAFLLFFSCGSKKERESQQVSEPAVSDLSGRALATAHCSRCHLLVEPEILPKSSWLKVLPAMHERMGTNELANADWEKLEKYYLDNAPESAPAPIRKHPIKMGLAHFKYRAPAVAHRPALTTMVKILPENQGIVFSDAKGKQKKMTFLNAALQEQYTVAVSSAPTHFYQTGKQLYLTTAGNNIFPTDAVEGAVQRWTKNATDGQFAPADIPISNLRRPVNMAYGDLNGDGLEDLVACEFGNEKGQLSWFENNGRGGYEKRILNERPGAISAIIKDANADGMPDIYVLMAQADEGIFLYENKGKGNFEEKRLLTFSPLNGSQYIELADFNKDGFDDILYVCGDNADKTPILKSYHGIYIFLNDGKSNFKQSYFYHLNGAYKAMARDYDRDGDLDIAAISFFPDYERSPEESFVYLKNKGKLDFEDYSFPQSSEGRWSVMDAGDMDGDGDIDIVLGSFVYFIPMGDKSGLGKKWLSDGPSVIVLENVIN